jgi:hypothetical protein
MNLHCKQDERRAAVRRLQDWNGLDYVEVGADQRTLHVYFLGKLPPELRTDQPGIERYLRIEGGRRVTGIRILDADPLPAPEPDKDDVLVLHLDKAGDFSTYTVRLTGVRNIAPRYDHAEFSFKVGCRSDLDCAQAAPSPPAAPAEPEINYLAKDYASFRQLILDRLALLMPGWQERHVPDLGIALVELLAYSGDMLSYYQDAVATEAYLDTARQRISVRRHARLVDYQLHEGCNARTWICIGSDTDYALPLADAAFITGVDERQASPRAILAWDDLRATPASSYEVFEALLPQRSASFALVAAHSEIHFHTWGDTMCCLARGSTGATLLDRWVAPDKSCRQRRRALDLAPGDLLVLEEVRGAVTGLAADADPLHRHVVRLTRVTPGVDPIILTAGGQPTPIVEVEWAAQDRLPFPLCLSAMGGAPECALIEHVSVARGNVILVDHGRTQPPEDLGAVPLASSSAQCDCVGQPGDVRLGAGPFRPRLRKTALTMAAPLPPDAPARAQWTPAASLLAQDVHAALPQLRLASQPAAAWTVRHHLLDSGPDDHHLVVEIDNDGIAYLRFGNGELGFQPPARMRFSAVYRTGNGVAGNVGAESITRLVMTEPPSGVTLTVRNPLPASGGRAAEPMAEAKLFAPHQFRTTLERAVTADDYRVLAERHPGLQRAAAALAWTGSWLEAEVAIDPLAATAADSALLGEIARELDCLRRIGHDVHVKWAEYVPLHLELEVCVLPYFQRAHVKAALLAAFGNRVLADGTLGFFHPDRLSFGEPVLVSRIVAAAHSVQGVACATVKVLQRLFEPGNHEIANGVLRLRAFEIAQLDNDPDYPERGKLAIHVLGGR